jgi:ABC-2 type transport system ATP-binding protein
MPDLSPPAPAARGRSVLTPASDRTLQDTAPAPRGAPAPVSVPLLLFEQVSKWYGLVIGVNQVTLELRPGITGLVGSNGAGKTTLLRLAAGLLRPDLGRVWVCGHEAHTAAARRCLGFCPEQDTFPEGLTGRQFLEMLARLDGLSRQQARRRSAELLVQVGLQEPADRPVSSYSRGLRQRLKLAQALLHDPPLLLLDEPLAGIDPLGRRDLIALFRQLAAGGKGLLLSSHELEEVDRLTDQVAIMAHGRIAAVGPAARLRELLAKHPISIRIICYTARSLAQMLLAWEEVTGLDCLSADTLLVRTCQVRRFFQRLQELVLEEGLELRQLQTLDDSTQSLLHYLLNGAGEARW